ncbi:uncharacterized protein LOC108676552 isoform X2 [Hyalella azteca]|uniref:Uncharacterized protein LOC108676552 isoform X2 n=1 Tax=Hyalella azteca TaxID=294128 RepID=A0A979FHD1_HYAAZ|nr:uncharacterized protein LOC108676552 isoform X2 [Hyalella azteca]
MSDATSNFTTGAPEYISTLPISTVPANLNVNGEPRRNTESIEQDYHQRTEMDSRSSTNPNENEVTTPEFAVPDGVDALAMDIIEDIFLIHTLARRNPSLKCLSSTSVTLHAAFVGRLEGSGRREVNREISDVGIKSITESVRDIVRSLSDISLCVPFKESDEIMVHDLKAVLIELVHGRTDNLMDPFKLFPLIIPLKEFLSEISIIEGNINMVGAICGKRNVYPWSWFLSVKSAEDLIPKSGEAEACAVCLDTKITPQTNFGVLPNCKHVFCTTCIQGWLNPVLSDVP